MKVYPKKLDKVIIKPTKEEQRFDGSSARVHNEIDHEPKILDYWEFKKLLDKKEKAKQPNVVKEESSDLNKKKIINTEPMFEDNRVKYSDMIKTMDNDPNSGPFHQEKAIRTTDGTIHRASHFDPSETDEATHNPNYKGRKGIVWHSGIAKAAGVIAHDARPYRGAHRNKYMEGFIGHDNKFWTRKDLNAKISGHVKKHDMQSPWEKINFSHANPMSLVSRFHEEDTALIGLLLDYLNEGLDWMDRLDQVSSSFHKEKAIRDPKTNEIHTSSKYPNHDKSGWGLPVTHE